MPAPTNVEQLRSFVGLTGFLHNLVQHYSIIAALFPDLLCNKALSSKRPRKLPISCGEKHRIPFDLLETSLAYPLVITFPLLNDPFTLYIEASMAGAGEILTQVIQQNTEFILTFASHRFSETVANRGSTERKCMALL